MMIRKTYLSYVWTNASHHFLNTVVTVIMRKLSSWCDLFVVSLLRQVQQPSHVHNLLPFQAAQLCVYPCVLRELMTN